MRTSDARIIAELMEQLIETGPEGMASAFTAMLNLALRFERERHVGAQACERTPERNGFKLKRVDTPAGTLTVQGRCAIPSPGARTGAALLARGDARHRTDVHSGRVHPGCREGHGRTRARGPLLQPGQPRGGPPLDAELEAWRTRPLGAFPCLFLDARLTRRSAATAWCATRPSCRGSGSTRRAGAACVALSEAEVHCGGPLARLSRQPRGPRAARRPLHHPQDRLPRRGLAALSVPSGPKRHPRRDRRAMDRRRPRLHHHEQPGWLTPDRPGL